MSPGPKESSGWMWKAPGTSKLLLATSPPQKQRHRSQAPLRLLEHWV